MDIDESGFLSVQLLVDNVIPYNDDDDNENGVLDLAESGPMLDSMGNQVADDDLSPLSFMIMNLGVDLAGYRLEVTTSSIDGALAKFWDSPWKQNELTFPLNITFGPGSPDMYLPGSIYVESVEGGHIDFDVNLFDPSGALAYNNNAQAKMPRIKFRRTDNNSVLGTTTTTQVYVGERVKLQAVVIGAIGAQDKEWSVPGFAVKNYDLEPILPFDENNTPSTYKPSAAVTPIDLGNSNVKFHGIEGGMGRRVKYSFTIDGRTVSRYTKFNVLRPHADGDASKPVTSWTETFEGGVQINMGFNNTPEIIFGAYSNGVFTEQGIEFHYKSTDVFYGGLLKWLQIGERTTTGAHYDGTQVQGHYGAGLDGSFPFLAVDGAKAYDAPGIELDPSWRSLATEGNYRMYLMYQSPIANRIWVPLVYVDWRFKASAQSADGINWNLVPDSREWSKNPDFKVVGPENPDFIADYAFPEFDDYLQRNQNTQ